MAFANNRKHWYQSRCIIYSQTIALLLYLLYVTSLSRVGYAIINNQGSKNITQVVNSVTGTGSIVCIDSKLRATYSCYLNTR